jgi:HPt (histidine-containing phosphotransfer) domain-containing protein
MIQSRAPRRRLRSCPRNSLTGCKPNASGSKPARQEVVREGFTEKTHAELFRAAHDIKGEAATFGYPAVVGAAESLCRLVEHTPDMSRIPLKLVEQHVDAVRAIAREHARSDLVLVAGTLTRRLREVTDEFLRSENADRPDYLESIFAPTLVP